jgi:hypothetical protein
VFQKKQNGLMFSIGARTDAQLIPVFCFALFSVWFGFVFGYCFTPLDAEAY